ncbi:hypothetical protein F5Y09DRAFT_303095 [Xylaria sp. FL1042]|nr:hypothetical protein F5Y09DRAFT_303095 [Xylaria sp. FL1042]
MPTREIDNAITATKLSKGVDVSEAIGILDGDDEYDVYQGDDGCLDSAASSTGLGNPPDAIFPSQQLSTAFATPFAPIPPQEAFVAECTEKATTWLGKCDTSTTTPTKAVPHSPEVVDLAAQESRLILQLQTTNERKEREKLTTELLELLKRSDNLTLNAKTNQSSSATQGDVFEATDDRSVSPLAVTGAEERIEREMVETCLERERLEIAIIEERGERKLQGDSEKAFRRDKMEREPIVRRKTPPHLRRFW